MFLIRRYQPWIWKLLFPKVPFKGVAFSWGDTVYYSPDINMTPDLIQHEKVHLKQQKFSKWYGVICILRYKWFKSYRRRCEVEAYTAQAQFLKNEGKPWEHLADHLGSKMYGLMTPTEAKAVIFLGLK